MKSLFTLLIAILFSSILQAQDLHPCGTSPYKSDWLKEFQQRPESQKAQYRNGGPLYVPITMHLVGKDNGQSHYSLVKLMDGLCELNADFAPTNIQFFIEGDINFINNSAYFNHGTVVEGAEMMFANNIENTINCYTVNSPAGNCGYNLPYAGIALAHSCITGHTWSHEMGHALSIPHPFLGWEGFEYAYNTPTDTMLWSDAYTFFQDTLILDTVIVDTYYVEYVSRTNCTIAGDGFCDTPPDYQSGRWECDSNGESELQKDPDNVDFKSDATYIMSYSYDECQNAFTQDQTTAMFANLYEKKPDYLYNQNPMVEPITAQVTLNYPIENTVLHYQDIEIDWEAVDNATHYILQVSRIASFAFVEYQTITTGTNFIIPELLNNKTYRWRIQAFSEGYHCTEFSEVGVFKTEDIPTSIIDLSVKDYRVFPTLLNNLQSIHIELNATQDISAKVVLYALNGQEVQSQNMDFSRGMATKELSLNGVAKGLYILGIVSDEGAIYEKIIIQ